MQLFLISYKISIFFNKKLKTTISEKTEFFGSIRTCTIMLNEPNEMNGNQINWFRPMGPKPRPVVPDEPTRATVGQLFAWKVVRRMRYTKGQKFAHFTSKDFCPWQEFSLSHVQSVLTYEVTWSELSDFMEKNYGELAVPRPLVSPLECIVQAEEIHKISPEIASIYLRDYVLTCVLGMRSSELAHKCSSLENVYIQMPEFFAYCEKTYSLTFAPFQASFDKRFGAVAKKADEAKLREERIAVLAQDPKVIEYLRLLQERRL